MWSDYNPNSLYRIRFSLVNVNFRGYDDYGIFSFNWDHTFYPIQYFWDTGGVTGYTGILATVDKWMKSIETLYSSGKNLEWKTIGEDGSQEFERTGDVTSDENKYLSFRCGESRLYVGKLSVDYTFVRNYADVEPEIIVGLIPLIKGTAVRTGYFEFFVDRENERWLLIVPAKEYTTGWMPFDRLRDTGNFMSGYYADRRYHLIFDWYSSGRCHLIFNDRREGISVKFAGR